MSTTTDVLSLFKYDPVADADSTFNITQGLNNNWDKLDAAILLAIAAAGAYNPEESYAVGDYCTYKGKLHKCGTPISDGEVWNAEHWTETTVAAELVEVHDLLAPLGGATTPQAALAALGAGVRNNELDNPYFEVNQRDWSSGTPVYAYSLDRYYSNDIQVENLSQGVKLTPNGSGSLFFIQRITEEKGKAFEGKKMTLSLYIDEDNFFYGTFAFPAYKSDQFVDAVTFLGWTLRAYSLLNGETGFGIYPNSSSSSSISPIVWKAEMGENQTLAYKDTNDKWHLFLQPESDYAAQLLRCQRYLLRLGTSSASEFVRVSRIVSGNHIFCIPTPIKMRSVPVISGEPKVITMTNGLQSDFTFSAALFENCVMIYAYKKDSGLTDCHISLQDVFLSAEL